MAHTHGDDLHDDGLHRLLPHRALLTVVLAAVAVTAVGLLVLWPTGKDPGIRRFLGDPLTRFEGRVEDVRTLRCSAALGGQGRCLVSAVLLTSGPDRGTVVTLENPEGPGTPELSEGDRIIVSFDPEGLVGSQYTFSDFQRSTPLAWLAVLFAGAVVLLGRLRGVRALAGLAISLVVLLVFVLPAILEGSSPIAVAVVGSSVILLANLYLAHGFNLRTTTAVVGTLASLALIGLLAVIFVAAAHFTGLGTEEATFLQAASSRINLKGLLLGGIIIGSLGVLDDVTVTQSSAVWELHQANPGLGPRRLYHSALRIGRDHIASTVNTLVLAYAGASLPLLILLVEANQDVADVLTGELVAVEIVRTLVGSIGLVASVPITTALAALVVSREERAPAGTDTEVA